MNGRPFLRMVGVLSLGLALAAGAAPQTRGNAARGNETRGNETRGETQAGRFSDVLWTPPSPERARLNARVFDRVWNEVRRGYYDPRLHGVDWDAARAGFRPQALAASGEHELYRTINAMLDLLDDGHAAASPPAAVRRQDARYARRAVMGMTLMRGDAPEVWTVERVRPGSPAQAAGVQLGWTLTSIDGRPWSPDVETPEGRPVRLVLTDETGARHETTLVPQLMDGVEPFTADDSHPGVLVLTVEQFDQGLGRWLGQELDGLPPEVGVILDLRANPGGRLWEAESVLTCFLPRDQAWATRTGRTGRAVVLRASGDCGDRRQPVPNPVAVLVDGASRSAAELTPAALQEAGRGLVVGEKTPGSVLIAQETDLPDGGRLTLSRADFVTARGVRLEKRGVTPDIAVPRTLAQRRAGEDPALEAAIAALRGQDQAEAANRPSGL